MAITVWIASSPYGTATSKVLRKYKGEVVDSHVYDTGDSTYPGSTSGYSIGVSGVTTDQQVEVLHNAEVAYTLQGRSNYMLPIPPVVGDNIIQARVGTELSNTIRFSTDNLYTLVYPQVSVLESEEERVRQAWADGYLATGVTNDSRGNALNPALRSLIDTWGEWLGAPRVSGFTAAEYVTLLQSVLGIHQRGPHEQSLVDAANLLGTTGSSFMRLLDQISTMVEPRPRVIQGSNECEVDQASGWDLTNWGASVGVTAVTPTYFFTSGTAVVWKDLGLTVGKTYRIKFDCIVTGTTTTLRGGSGNPVIRTGVTTGYYDEMWVAENGTLDILIDGEGAIKVLSLEVYEVPELVVYPGKVRMDNRWFNVSYTDGIVLSAQTDHDYTEARGEVFVVLDPGKISSSGDLVPTITTGEPAQIEAVYTEYLTSGRVQTDTTGGVTGVISGKYITLERPPNQILQISGSPYVLLGSCRIVKGFRDQNSCIVDLGTRESIERIFTGGTQLRVDYTATRHNYMVLARVICNTESTSNTIVSVAEIHSPNRPGYGMVGVPTSRYHRSYSLMVSRSVDYGMYNTPEKKFVQVVVPKLAPIGAPGHLFFTQSPWEDPYTVHTGGTSAVLWLRARSLTGLTHGAQVAAWGSEIGSVSGAQATADYQPHLVTGATPSNGLAVRFGGLNSNATTYLNLSSSGLMTGATGFSAFVVNRSLNPTGNTESLFYISTSGGTDSQFGLHRWQQNRTEIGGSVRRVDSDAVAYAAGGEIVTNKYSVDGLVVDYLQNRITIYQNGAVVHQVYNIGSTGTCGVEAAAYSLIGAGPGLTLPLHGDISEILAFSHALDSGQAIRVSNFLHRVAIAAHPDLYLSRAFEYFGDINHA